MLFFTSEYEEYLFSKFSEGMLSEEELQLLLNSDVYGTVNRKNRVVDLLFDSDDETILAEVDYEAEEITRAHDAQRSPGSRTEASLKG